MYQVVAPYINGLWIALGVLWLLGAFSAKRAARLQSAASVLVHALLMIIAFELIFTHYLRFGILADRFVPDTALAADSGLALTACGVLFAAWARVTLGRNWSGMVTVKSHHTLVTQGPYRLVRHPIYSGITLAMLGTALAVGEIGALAGVAIAIVGWRLKYPIEEKFMVEQFGAQYVEYRRHTKALIPHVL